MSYLRALYDHPVAQDDWKSRVSHRQIFLGVTVNTAALERRFAPLRGSAFLFFFKVKLDYAASGRSVVADLQSVL